MEQGIAVVIYPVSDLAQAKTPYRTLLGVEPEDSIWMIQCKR